MEEILQGSEEDSYFLPSCLETFAIKFFFFLIHKVKWMITLVHNVFV